MEKKLKHLAIIIDGNRRYAKNKSLKQWKGHSLGAENLENFFNWCMEFEIKEITIYTLSTENLNRDKNELNHLFSLFKKFFNRLKENKKIDENKIRIKIIGKKSLLPSEIQELCNEIENKTKENDNYKINFCIAYGGRLELLEAFNSLKNKEKEITEKELTNSLWLTSEPDLIIRTGNRKRTSNFLPWQSVYSEWLFLEKMWPEFTKQDLKEAIEYF